MTRTAGILLAINILIILAAEFTETLFFNRGIIHIIALIFVGAAAIPLARNYYLAEPIFKKFLTTAILAFVLFSASHISEFFQFYFSGGYNDHIFAITINFYLTSILFMMLGSEIYIRAYSGYRRSRIAIAIISFAVVVLIFFAFFMSVYPNRVSMELDSPLPYIYGTITAAIVFFLWRRLEALKKIFNLSFGSFFRYLFLMLIFVTISIFFNAFYEFLEEGLGIPEYEIVYFSHFFFYGGLSIMFLAFEELLKVGGILKDLRDRANSSRAH